MKVVIGLIVCVVILIGIGFAIRMASRLGLDETNSPPSIVTRKKPPQTNNGSDKSQTSGDSRSKSQSTSTQKKDAEANKPTDPNASPYKDLIYIASARPASYPINTGAAISIRSKTLTEPVLITGWQIKSNKGNLFIPEAVNDVHISGYLVPSPIIIGSNATVWAYDTMSPMRASIRLNKCTGYLNNTLKFSPNLPNECPRVIENRSEISHLSGACQSYLASIGTCKEVTTEKKNSFSHEPQCRAIMEKFGADDCYNKHRFDADFFKNEWRLWLAQEFPFDRIHDVIRLYDSNRLLVDEYSY